MKEPAIPDKIDLIANMTGTTIRRTWLGWSVVPLAIFCIAWDSFLFFWYSMALGGDKAPWIAIVFPVGHVAVGIGLTYYVVASLLNKTDLTISPAKVTVSSYPIPWGARKEVDTGDIVNVRVKYTSSNNGNPSYGIRYTNRNNREKSLIRGGLSDDQAEFIVYHLRKILNLKEDEEA
jgi:hypothetical protein